MSKPFLSVLPLLAVLLCLLVGCTTPGRFLDAAAVQQVHRGQTQNQVRKIFGTPKRTDTGSNSRQLDAFYVVVPKQGVGRVRILEVRSLHVLYDQKGQVEKFTFYTGEAIGIIQANKTMQAGNAVDMENVKSIRRGITSREDLIQTFGPATIEGLNVVTTWK